MRVVVAECSSAKDIELAKGLLQQVGLGAELIVLKKTLGDRYALKKGYSSRIAEKRPPSKFESYKELWQWIIKNFPAVNEAIVLRLHNADLPVDALQRYYKLFQDNKSDYMTTEYGFFTNARLEFLSPRGILRLIEADQKAEVQEAPSAGIPTTRITWPQREDYQYFFKEQFQRYFGIPKSLNLDLNPHCNKRCDKCQFHSPRSPYADKIQGAQMMSKELAFKILREASTWKPKPALAPTYSGEPLLYPHLYEVLAYAKRLGYPIAITTNGVALTEEASRRLLDLRITSLVVSVDAASDQTYDLLQAPGGLSRVTTNLLRFLELRGQRKTPVVGVHFVMEKRNQEEFDAFFKFWEGKVDFVSRAIHQDQFSSQQLTLRPFLPLGRRQACFGPWQCLYIRWNGDVSFCGFDFHSRDIQLNVTKQSLLDIWNSELFWEWREAQLAGDQSVIYCKACPDWAAGHTVTVYNGKRKVVRSPIQETYYPAADRAPIRNFCKKILKDVLRYDQRH